ncbi:MAG TPA: sulfatase-like hydrolase/transferase [Clostridiaceae bacterium]|nr:sulfatase-like hydrolase/transferase [Clostridiaceae bacterium]
MKLLFFIGTFLFVSAIWFRVNFGDIPFEQLLFHLRVPIGTGNLSAISSYFLFALPVTILAVFLILKGLQRIKNNKKNELAKLVWIRKVSLMMAVIVFLGGITFGIITLHIPAYYHYRSNESQNMEIYYVDPDSVNITFPEQKRNVIYLFAESMESSFTNKESGGIFTENYIPELTQLAQDDRYIHFSNTDQLGGAYQMPGLGWTIAGIVGQTAGLPLKIPISGEENRMQESFLPGAKSIGDILDDEGYHLEFMMGSDAEFGGRKYYLQQHGNFFINDHPFSIRDGRLPEEYYVDWGYEDEKLFNFAKARLEILAEESQPFYFGLLTVDTHFPNGHVYDDFPQPFDSQYGNAIYGSDHMITDFIHWFEEQPFYENTTLVVAGDHLTMEQQFVKDKPDGYARTTYNLFVNSAVQADDPQQKYRSFCTLDLFPTTLAAMGVEIEGDQLAYGVNLFSQKKTLVEELGYQKFQQMLQPYSSFYENEFFYK